MKLDCLPYGTAKCFWKSSNSSQNALENEKARETLFIAPMWTVALSFSSELYQEFFQVKMLDRPKIWILGSKLQFSGECSYEQLDISEIDNLVV